MFFGFDTKPFKDWLKGASSTELEFQINWCKELFEHIEDGLMSHNNDIEKYLSTLIHVCEEELKRRKKKK